MGSLQPNCFPQHSANEGDRPNYAWSSLPTEPGVLPNFEIPIEGTQDHRVKFHLGKFSQSSLTGSLFRDYVQYSVLP